MGGSGILDERTDAELIAGSIEDPARFDALFRRHYPAIHRYAHRRVGSHLADEVAAETFAIAFARRSDYDPSRPDAAPWLYGIAANLLRAHRRTERRQLLAFERTGIDPVAPDAIEGIDARIDASIELRRVAGRVAALRDEEREVLLLSAWTDLTYEQIAEALGVPVGTVRSRLSRARRHVVEPAGLSVQERDGDQIREASDERA